MPYVFMSFASAHAGKNIGCCIIESEDPNDANQKAKDLGLMPEECNHAKGYVLEDIEDEDMELNKFYTNQQMAEMGYEKG